MMADEGRPTFDLSTFCHFAWPTIQPEEPGISRIESGTSQDQRLDSSIPTVTAPEASGDKVLLNLTKYGPPDAIAKLNQNVPNTIITVIENSIETVRGQIEAELELSRRREEAERSPRVQKEQSEHRSEDDTEQQLDKGKAVESPEPVRDSAPESSAASMDHTDTPPFYTAYEAQSPPADTDSDNGTEASTAVLTAVSTAVNNGPAVTPIPLPRSSSTSAIPRRRDLIKAMFRKTSEGETRRQAIRRSAGTLQLKAKLKQAKQVWHGGPQTRFVSSIKSLQLLLFASACLRL